MKKRVVSLLLAFLFVLSFSSVCAESALPAFATPEEFKTIPSGSVSDRLPADLPREAVAVTGVSFDESALSVQLSREVPSLSIIQYDDDYEEVVLASAENVSSLTAENPDISLETADLFLTWPLSGGSLVCDWAIWDDGSAEFVQCQYETQMKGSQYAPYDSLERIIELDEEMQVLTDTYYFTNDTDGFSVLLRYDDSGILTDYDCSWDACDDAWFSVMLTADQTVFSVSWHSGSTDCYVVSDPVASFLAGDSLILDSVGNEESFLSALAEKYPQLPVSEMELPEEDFWDEDSEEEESDEEWFVIEEEDEEEEETVSVPATDIEGTLWCIVLDEDENRTVYSFLTSDPFLLLENGRIRLNPEAKDLNGMPPEFTAFDFSSLAVQIPVLQ